MPAFVDIGESFAEAGREASVLRSFLSAGFLGAEYGPFPVPRPEEAAKQLQSAIGPAHSSKRLKNFRALLDASPALELASSYQQESMMQSIDQAYRLINSPTAKVFELDREPKHAINSYNAGPVRYGMFAGATFGRSRGRGSSRFILPTNRSVIGTRTKMVTRALSPSSRQSTGRSHN